MRRLRGLAHTPRRATALGGESLRLAPDPLYDAALDHDAVHALQHVLFFVCGMLVWAALLEPLPGPAWFTAGRKLAFVAAMWAVSLALSQVFLWSGHAYYARYVDAQRTWGLSPLADQRAGGGIMLVEGSLVMIGVAVWLLFRLFRESESRQRLLDAGLRPTPRRAPRATDGARSHRRRTPTSSPVAGSAEPALPSGHRGAARRTAEITPVGTCSGSYRRRSDA